MKKFKRFIAIFMIFTMVLPLSGSLPSVFALEIDLIESFEQDSIKEIDADESLLQDSAEDIASDETFEQDYATDMESSETFEQDSIIGNKEKVSIIVKYKNNAQIASVKNSLKSKKSLSDIKIARTFSELKTELIEIETVESAEAIAREIALDENVEYAHPNYTFEPLSVPSDPDFDLQWGLKNNGQEINGQTGTEGIDINILPVWDGDYEFSEVIVGILDTGIDTSHEDLQSRFADGWDFANNDATVFDPDDPAHGTQISGIIAANHNNTGIAGIAPNAKIMPLKFIQNGYGYTSDAIAAIEFAAQNGVKIINCSWGSDIYNPALKDVMEQNSDILFVCAAGNSGGSYSVYPAAFDLPNVISVTAINNNGDLWALSNYGANVDIAAPGKDIYTVGLGNTYGFVSGTSMATAFVASAAALYMGVNENDTVSDTVDMINQSVSRLDSLSGKIKSSGMLNASNLIEKTVNNEEIPDVKPDKEIPPELIDIVNSGAFYSDLSEEYKLLFLDYYEVRIDTMTECCEAGLTIAQSITKALIMQRMQIHLSDVEMMITNHGGINEADKQSLEYRDYVVRTPLFYENDHVMSEFVAGGYPAKKVVFAFAAANLMDVDLAGIIDSFDDNTASNISFAGNLHSSSLTQEDKDTLLEMASEYNVRIESLWNYCNSNNLSPNDLKIKLIDQKYSLKLVREVRYIPLSNSAGDEYDHLTAPFNYRTNANETVNLDTGALIYEETIANLPGVDGEGFELAVQYDSDRAMPVSIYHGDTGQSIASDRNNYYYVYVEARPYIAGKLDAKIIPNSTEDFNFIYELNSNGTRLSYYDAVAIADSYQYRRLPYLDFYKEHFPQTWANVYNSYYYNVDPLDFRFKAFVIPHPQNSNFTEARANKIVYKDLIDATGYMGAGWSLKLDRIVDTQTYNAYLRLRTGDIYELNEYYDNYYGNYELQFLSSYTRGMSIGYDRNMTYPGGSFVLRFSDGKREYFDPAGRIVGIVDRYGKDINFFYGLANSNWNFALKITDTAGKLTVIEYTNNNYYPNAASFYVKIKTPDGNETLYTMQKYTENNKPCFKLIQKADPLGNITKYEYQATGVQFNYWEYYNNLPNKVTAKLWGQEKLPEYQINSKVSPSPAYAYLQLLKKVEYIRKGNASGVSRNYVYDVPKDKNWGLQGRSGYYRLTSRYDSIPGSNTKYNEQTYSYSSTNYTYYPGKRYFDGPDDSSRKIHTTTVAEPNKNISSLYWFDLQNRNTLIQVNRISPSGMIRSEEKEYDKHHKLINSNKQYGAITSKEEYTFTDSQKLLEYWNPFANSNRSNAEYKTTNTYNTYELLRTSIYKKDSATTIKVDNIMTQDNKSIQSAKVYANNILESQTDFVYDINGNLTKETKYIGSGNTIITNCVYQNNLLISKTTGGVTESYEYDLMSRIKKIFDGKGYVTEFSYDALGRLTQIKNPDNSIVTRAYDDTNNILTVTNEKSAQTKYYYDILGNLIKVRDIASGAETTYTYDLISRVATETDPKGAVTTYTYDYMDRVTKKEIKSGSTVMYTENYTYQDGLDANTSMATKTITGETNAPAIKTAEYTDKLGRLVKQSRFLGSTEYSDTFSYDYVGNKIQEVRDSGVKNQITKYEYDFAGNVTKITNPDNSIYQLAYDWLGRKIGATDPKGKASSFEYDSLNRLTHETTPFQTGYYAEKWYYYDNNSNVTAQEQKNNAPGSATTKSRTELEYDNRNRLTVSKMLDGSTVKSYTEYEYDAVGNKTKMSVKSNAADAQPQVTQYEYDAQNRLKKLTDALGQFESYSYDENSNLTGKTDRNGNVTVNTYDALNHLTQVKVNNVSKLTYTYAKTGAKLSEQNENLTTSFIYDSLGRLTKETESNGIVKDYTYDSVDNRLSMSVKQNSAEKLKQTYEYDNMNRLWKTYDNGSLAATYTYDANGNRSKIEYPRGLYTDYYYNDANLITSLQNKYDTSTMSSWDYTYYLDGNQASEIDTRYNVETKYEYDGLGRLIKETEKNASNVVQWSKAYTFDKAGNRETMTVTGKENYVTSYSYDENNRLLEESKVEGGNQTVQSYSYDNNGNQISRTSYSLTTDLAGNPQMGVYAIGVANPSLLDSYVSEIYEYDSLNQLEKVTNNNGVSEYVYKPNGLRLSKTVNGAKTRHVWDGSNMVLEYGDNNAIIGKYIRGIGLIKNQDNKYFMFNAHGDVVHFSEVEISSFGPPLLKFFFSYEYDAFGVLINHDLFANDTNPWRYAGEYFDKETGSYYLRARYYDSLTSRMLTEDPIRDGLNWYTYCGGNPVNRWDPSGLYWTAKGWKSSGNPFLDVFDFVTNCTEVNSGITPISRGSSSAAITAYKNYYGRSPDASGFTKFLGGFGGGLLQAVSDTNGVRHISQDWWQQYVGFCSFYDYVFDAATSMTPATFDFSYQGFDMRFWAWKGDYLSFGAGAEFGVYYNGGPLWASATGCAIPMTMRVSDMYGNEISYWDPGEPNWWITSFNPAMQRVDSYYLRASFTLDLRNYRDFYNSIYSAWNDPNRDWYHSSQWTFNDGIATFTF